MCVRRYLLYFYDIETKFRRMSRVRIMFSRLAARRLAPATHRFAPRFISTSRPKYALPTESIESEDSATNNLTEATPNGQTDWSTSFSGLSQQAFSKEVADILLAPVDPLDVEIKPGTILFAKLGGD